MFESRYTQIRCSWNRERGEIDIPGEREDASANPNFDSRAKRMKQESNVREGNKKKKRKEKIFID